MQITSNHFKLLFVVLFHLGKTTNSSMHLPMDLFGDDITNYFGKWFKIQTILRLHVMILRTVKEQNQRTFQSYQTVFSS